MSSLILESCHSWKFRSLPPVSFSTFLLFIYLFLKTICTGKVILLESKRKWDRGSLVLMSYSNLVANDSVGLSQEKILASPSSQKWLQYEVMGINHTPFLMPCVSLGNEFNLSVIQV